MKFQKSFSRFLKSRNIIISPTRKPCETACFHLKKPVWNSRWTLEFLGGENTCLKGKFPACETNWELLVFWMWKPVGNKAWILLFPWVKLIFPSLNFWSIESSKKLILNHLNEDCEFAYNYWNVLALLQKSHDRADMEYWNEVMV